MTGIRISFAVNLRHEFSDLAGLYDAEFGGVKFSQIHKTGEPGSLENLVLVVPEGLPAFLSSKGFAFQVID
jgi:hypothetical protein